MKQFPMSTFLRTAMVAVAAVLLTACVHARNDYYEPAPHYPPQVVYYDYWYYPAIGCYFDIRTNYYIYFEHGSWIRVRVLPPHLRPYLGRHVTVRSPHQRPYDEHYRHREQHPPERYKQTRPGEKGHDAWVGPPRTEIPDRDRRDKNRDQDRNGGDTRRDGNGDRGPGREIPERERDNRRQDNGDRRQDGQGQERDRNGDRTPGAGQRENREHAEDYKRPEPKTQSREAPGRREPGATTAPAKPPYKEREQEQRKEAAQKRDRDASERRDDDHNKDANDSKPGKERRGPDNRDETGR